ncbi:tetratricopeptide repeat protein [Actinosynnema sp. NPDC020468]|uniref:ATP-binding protein n=1 Tax=Actinosynnema sp. NPDC020468 TaxID=3154488 RepID=UPI003410B993
MEAAAVHRAIVVVDVEGFGDPARTLPHQLDVRAGLYRVVERAFAAVGVAFADCRHEDRGDAVFVLVPPEVPKATLVEELPGALAAEVVAHNEDAPPPGRIRLRVAVHAGEVALDRHGATSTAVTTAFRLLDARPVRHALAASPGVLALVVSRWVYDEVVRHCAVLDPATFRPVPVRVKETATTAWVALPDHPYPADPAAPHPGPHRLPAAPPSFVGRSGELAALDAAGPLAVIAGTGGIGKTWLALHWAHRDLDRWPDGRLFVDLRGFAPAGEPVDPLTAVRGFLEALDEDVDRLTGGLAEHTARYRELVAGKKVLVVLDNAASADQVAPLLPGPDATVLVTSRRTLSALVARHGARQVPLSTLDFADAEELLTRRLGPVDADVLREVAESCGGHPLALAVAAGRVHTRPRVPPAEFAAELREHGLRALDDEDPAASVPAVLSWSVRGLADEGVLALLAVAPGPDIGVPAAARLADVTEDRARKALRALEDASLVERRPGGRFALHDLVRDFAADRAHDADRAVWRLVEHHLHQTCAADRVLHPYRRRIPLAQPLAEPVPPPDVDAATTWFEAERPAVLASRRAAQARGWHLTVWQLAWASTNLLLRRGHRHDDLAGWESALVAARHLRDPTALGVAHRFTGRALLHLGRHDEAIRHLEDALALAGRHHDVALQAHTHREIAAAWDKRGDHRLALEHACRALHLYRVLDQPAWEAEALNSVGWYEAHLGAHDQARAHCAAALTLHRRHDNSDGEAATLDSLGFVDHRSGRHEDAVRHYTEALTLRRNLGNTYQSPATLENLGHPLAALGLADRVTEVWREAAELYRRQGRDQDADRVADLLDRRPR